MLKIPQNIEKIIKILEDNNFEAYVVGGAVRDTLLGFVPQDYDITTSCPPETVVKLFEKTIPTGIKHGTVTVIIDSIPTEVTTYRIDGLYLDNRSPDSVSFTANLEDDLSRRDFTVNSLAFNKNKGLVDIFGGQDDIKNKTIKTVGNPQKRFSEDALRILRAIRFACTLDFNIENNTYNSAVNLSNNLKHISGERIYTELTKSILGKNCEVLEDFINKGGLNALNITYSSNLKKINYLSPNLPLRIFSFLNHTDADYEYLSHRLHFSNKIKDYLDRCFYIKNNLKNYNKSHIKSILGYTESDIFADYLEYKSVILNENTEQLMSILKEIKTNNEPYKISMLNIDGKDLESLGFSGEEVGKKLKFLLQKCIESPELNNKNNLLKLLSN